MKKIISAFLLSVLLLLMSCNEVKPAVTTDAATLPPLPVQTTSGTETAPPEPVEVTELKIIDNGATSYKIIYPSSDSKLKSAAVALRTVVKNTTGARMATFSDENAAQELEIVLGTTSRGADIAGAENIKDGEALIAVKDKKVYILGESEAVASATAFFGSYYIKENKSMSVYSDISVVVNEAMGKMKPVCNTVEVKGLNKTYNLLHVTDAHLCLIDDDETKARKDYNKPRIGLFSADGMTSAERFPYFFDFAEEMNYDAIVMTGDITDQPSDANIALVKAEINASKTKCVFVVGNHDWSFSDSYWTAESKTNELPKFSDISGGNTSYRITEYEDLVILSVDNGTNTFKQEHIDAFNTVKALGKPVILAMHLPISAPELSVASKKVWGGRDICIGPDGVGNNDISNTFISLITAEDSPVAAILCGHVHFSHVENVGNIPQFVTDIAAYGNCRVLTLVPASSEE